MKQADLSGLSRNEQLVLYHLVRYPMLSDKEAYKMIGMRQSTYSTIKKKLKELGIFYTSYAPILQHLGSELLVVWYVTLNRKTRTQDRLALTRNDLLGASELFTIVSESNQAILLSMNRNIANHVSISDQIVQLYEKYDFLEEIHYVLFPFDVSYIFSFFDFAPLLNRIFEIEPPNKLVGDTDVNSDQVRGKVKFTELNELEKRVYLGLVKYPDLSDSLLSDKIGCSRQVFTRIKLRLLHEKLIKKRSIISLDKLGFKILAMTHSKFNPLKPVFSRQRCVQKIVNSQTPIFNIARNPESVMLTAYRDFEEFKMLHHEFVTFCEEHDTLRGDPVTLLLSIPRIFEIKWLVYEPLVRKMLSSGP